MIAVERIIPWFYWLIPLVSVIMQYVMNRAGSGHIRPEEISESVRGPYWLAHGRIFQGLSGHIGWYAPLIVWYQIFGFSLRGAVDFRLVVHIISVMCLALLLKKHIGVKVAWIPLAAFCFSPTLLYFNSLMAQYGADFQYIPICLFLLDRARFTFHQDHKFQYLLPHAVLWILVMIAWMAYPTVSYYLPALALVYLYKMRLSAAGPAGRTPSPYIFISLVSFLLPLVVGFAYVQNRTLLLYDAGDKSGIFRGAAHTFDLAHGWDRVRETVAGFISVRPSYYYEVSNAEFSGGFPLIALSVLAVVCSYLWIRRKKYRVWIVPVLVITLLNILALMIFSDTGGGVGYACTRRATGILASVYILLTIACHYIGKSGSGNKFRFIFFLIFLFIPIHHLAVFFSNVQGLKGPSMYEDVTWFHTKPSIDESLFSYLDALARDDIQVVCPYAAGVQVSCMYNRLYAAVSSSCHWNHRVCYQMWGYDPFRDVYVRLRLSLWDKEWSWEKYDSELNKKLL
jgi:hypothetical protein